VLCARYVAIEHGNLEDSLVAYRDGGILYRIGKLGT
jgi:hypothetical protein